MHKKIRGFSLAELLIALLVVSIVLSAAIPTVTKRAATSEQIWRWSKQNNSAYFGVGSLQSALLGISSIPENSDGTIGLTNTFSAAGVDSSNIRFTNSGDKLVILKQSNMDAPDTHLMNSHISFYNLKNGATGNDITYVGRVAMDQHNLALGIGTLQSMNDIQGAFIGRNTAIGHYALLNTMGGEGNTAVGEKALSYNKYADDNTAIGYEAAFMIDRDSTSKNIDTNAVQNTAIGAGALRNSAAGRLNTAIGAYSLNLAASGVASTSIGASALYKSSGSGNTAIGTMACNELGSGSNNICLGTKSGYIVKDPNNKSGVNDSVDYGLFIGSVPLDTYTGKINDEPLIFGRMQAVGDKGREVNLNTDTFRVKTYNGASEFLNINMFSGTESNSFAGVHLFKVYAQAATDNHLKLSGDKTTIKLESDTENIDFKFGSKLAIKTDNNRVLFSSNKNFEMGSETKSNFVIEANSTSTIGISKTYGISLKLSDAADSPAIYIQNEGLNLTAQNKLINANSSNFQMAGSTLTLPKTDSYIIVGGTSGLVINTTDITIPKVSKGNKNIGANINDIWEKLETIEMKLYSVSSDERLKNIQGPSTIGLKEINAIEVKNYTYKDDKDKISHVGVIAQQLQKVLPNSVIKDKDGYLRIKTEEMFYAMLNSIKELYSKVMDLTAKVTGLDKRITELEKKNAQLEKQNKEFEQRLQKLEKAVK